MRSKGKHFSAGRSIGALILLGMLACAASGCGPYYDGYGYGGYPAYGYAPYSWGWGGWGYRPGFVVHHPWEGHYGSIGHHTEFYHGGGAVGHAGGDGFHGGGGGGHGGGGGGHR